MRHRVHPPNSLRSSARKTASGIRSSSKPGSNSNDCRGGDPGAVNRNSGPEKSVQFTISAFGILLGGIMPAWKCNAAREVGRVFRPCFIEAVELRRVALAADDHQHRTGY